MNDAHLHLLVNHIPIIGTIFGFGILLVGIFTKNITLKNTAFSIFIISAIFCSFSMSTGEGAEEIVEDFPNIGKQIIHEHEELAEKLAIILYVLAGFSALEIYLNFKKHKFAVISCYIIVVIAIVAIFLAQKTGTSGGEIRHTEIRESTLVSYNPLR